MGATNLARRVIAAMGRSHKATNLSGANDGCSRD
jgi:hypothetical protein